MFMNIRTALFGANLKIVYHQNKDSGKWRWKIVDGRKDKVVSFSYGKFNTLDQCRYNIRERLEPFGLRPDSLFTTVHYGNDKKVHYYKENRIEFNRKY